MCGSEDDSQHEILISSDFLTAGTWHWFIDYPSRVKDLSVVLGEQVHEDRCTNNVRSSTIKRKEGVTEAALRSIISSLDGTSDDQPPDLFNFGPLGDFSTNFSQLLDVAIACWEYRCSTDPFQNAATRVKMQWNNHQAQMTQQFLNTNCHQRSINWLFTALVFNWNDILGHMLDKVILRYDPVGLQREEDNEMLPQEFRDLVQNARREQTRMTFTYIKTTWITLSRIRDEEALAIRDRIDAHFLSERVGLDFGYDAPADLHSRFDPNSLLDEFKNAIYGLREHEEELNDHVVNVTANRALLGHAGGIPHRGGGRSLPGAMAHGGQRIFRGMRNLVRHNRSPAFIPERRQRLLMEMENWRLGNLIAGVVVSAPFFEARNRHILPAMPQQNGA